jgi:hypothetical protein
MIIHPIICIRKYKRLDGHLRIYCYPECAVIKIFQRFSRHIKCAFRKNNNRYPFFQDRFHVSYTLCPVICITAIYPYHCIFINKAENRYFGHFSFTQCSNRLSQGFHDEWGIQIRNMIADKNILFVFLQRLLIIITVINKDQEEPKITP